MKSRLKGSKMLMRKQARVVEACVESALLFDCQVRVWYVKEVKRMMKVVVLGWLEELDGWEKSKGRKRKTVL